MATHSSILAWRIPWTEEPGGLGCGEVCKIRAIRYLYWNTWGGRGPSSLSDKDSFVSQSSGCTVKHLLLFIQSHLTLC